MMNWETTALDAEFRAAMYARDADIYKRQAMRFASVAKTCREFVAEHRPWPGDVSAPLGAQEPRAQKNEDDDVSRLPEP